MEGFQQATVTENHKWNNSLCSIKAKPEGDITFISGQYTKVAIDNDGKIEARPYSIVSAPNSADLEFFIIKVDNGPLSNILYDKQPGDKIFIEQRAHGFLTLAETSAAPVLWLLGTGTGISPFIPMVREGKVFQDRQQVILVQGVRTTEDLAYSAELEDIEEKEEKFQYVQVVSRSNNIPDKALQGRITTAILNGGLEQRVSQKLHKDNSHVMLCGNPQMIEESIGLLEERGMQRHRRRKPGHISIEKYW